MAFEVFLQAFFGSSLRQYAFFFVIVLSFLLLGKIMNFFLKNYVKRITAKTKSEFDDLLLEAAHGPITLLSFIIGILIGINFLTFLPEQTQTISHIINILFVIDFTWFSINIIDGLVLHFLAPIVLRTKSRTTDQLIPIVSKGLKAAILVMAFIVMIGTFGFDITALIAGLGIGGLAIAFAAQQTIADAFGGLNIFFSKPFFVGDKVQIENVEGKVEQIGIRHTRIRDFDGRLNIISNSRVSSAIIKNVTSEPGRKIRLNLGVTYETSSEKIKKATELIKEILERQQNVDKDDIVIGFNEFKDYSLNIFAMFFIREPEYANIVKTQNTINLAIKEAFEKNKIEFAYPTHTVHMAK